MKHLRTIGALGLATVLSGCMAAAPSTEPVNDRNVVTGEQAAELFLQNCYNSPNGEAVLRNPAFEKADNGNDDTVAALHRTLLVKFQTVGDRCVMIFRGNKAKAETRKDFAKTLNARVSGELSTSDRGTPLSITTDRGKVSFTGSGLVVSGPTPPTNLQDFEIWFKPTE